MRTKLLLATLVTAGLLASSADAATVFLTNDTASKTLASNESDAAALEGAVATTVTPLTLSADDGGGSINLTTVSVLKGTANDSLGMDGNSMGVENDKFGNNPQSWQFSFDQIVSFDAVEFDLKSTSNKFEISSTAWGSDADATGTGWSFTTSGGVGTFLLQSTTGSTQTFDFTTASFSDVAADTSITFYHDLNLGLGGLELRSFTISPVPEPGSLALLGLGGLLIGARRRRNA